MPRRLDWADYRFAEFEGIDPEQVIAILPTAAIEQHGPHLPVGTDTMIAQGMLDRVRATVPDDLDIRILPIQAVGKSNEHLHAPGTLTLTAETALKAWVEIGLSVARAGVRKIVIVNSHGGNLDLVSATHRRLRRHHACIVRAFRKLPLCRRLYRFRFGQFDGLIARRFFFGGRFFHHFRLSIVVHRFFRRFRRRRCDSGRFRFNCRRLGCGRFAAATGSQSQRNDCNEETETHHRVSPQWVF